MSISKSPFFCFNSAKLIVILKLRIEGEKARKARFDKKEFNPNWGLIRSTMSAIVLNRIKRWGLSIRPTANLLDKLRKKDVLNHFNLKH